MILSSPTQLAAAPSRIISLVPSQTELLFDLGLEHAIIGITKFCVHPERARQSKTIIGGTKNIDINLVKKLAPDLIIANQEENVKEQVEELASEFPVWITTVGDLQDACQMIADIGQLTNTEGLASGLVAKAGVRFTLCHPLYSMIPAVYLIWKDPYMTIGGDTFISDMLNRCGLKNCFAGEKRYPAITIDDIKNSECKVLLLSTEPYPFKQEHVNELEQLLPGIIVIIADGEIFSWYGSRLLKAHSYFRTLRKSIRDKDYRYFNTVGNV